MASISLMLAWQSCEKLAWMDGWTDRWTDGRMDPLEIVILFLDCSKTGSAVYILSCVLCVQNLHTSRAVIHIADDHRLFIYGQHSSFNTTLCDVNMSNGGLWTWNQGDASKTHSLQRNMEYGVMERSTSMMIMKGREKKNWIKSKR